MTFPNQLELFGTLLGINSAFPVLLWKHFTSLKQNLQSPSRKRVKPYLPLTASVAELIEISRLTQTQRMAVRGWLITAVALLSATSAVAHGEYRTPGLSAVSPPWVCLHFLLLLTLNSRSEESRQAEG